MRLGLQGKLTLVGLSLTTFIALSGLGGLKFAHERLLMNDSIEEGRILGRDLALQSEGFLVRGSEIELRDLVERFASLKGVSYILITDQKGEIKANTLKGQKRVKSIIQRGGRITEGVKAAKSPQGRGYELTIPILEGTLGTLYLGLSPLAKNPRNYWTTAGILLGGSLLFSWILIFLLSHRLSHRLLQLALITERVSLGYMEERIPTNSGDEIGKLAQATDRLRISLQGALERLGKGEGIGRT